MRLTLQFSPIFWTSASLSASSSPSMRLATSVPGCAWAALAMRSANARKFSSFAAKSVSQLTSTMVPPFSSDFTTIVPSAAIRPAFLAAFKPLDFLRLSIASSILPSASTKAFLQSIIPSPVISRSSFTIAAVIAAILVPFYVFVTPAGAGHALFCTG